MASIKKNLVFNFILSASQLLLPLISIPYISHVLDPQGIGKVSFIDSLTYYFISIAEFGIVVYGIREVARLRSNKEALSKLIGELMTLHIVSSVISICLYGITVLFLWSKIHDVRLILFSFSFLLVNSFACEWYYYGTEQFRYITSRSIVTRLCGLACIFILVRRPDDYFIYYASIAGAAMLNIIWNVTRLPKGMGAKLFRNGWQQHIRKTWVTYFISLLYSVSLMLDNVMLGLMSSAVFVAFYAFAIKLIRLSALALTDTLLVFFPHLVSLLHNQEKEKFQQAISRNVQILNLFSLPIGVGIFFLSNEIANVIFGPAFHQIAVDLRILAIVPFLRCYNLFLSKQVLIAYDNERFYFRSLLAAGLIFVAASLSLSYYFQDVGAAVSMVVYETSLLIFNYYYARKTDPNLRIIDWRSLAHAMIGAILFVPLILIVRHWMEVDWVLLSLLIFFSAFLYVSFQIFVLKNELMNTLRRSGFKFISDQFQRRNRQ